MSRRLTGTIAGSIVAFACALSAAALPARAFEGQTSADALADARFFFATLRSVHPDPARKLGEPGLAALERRALAEVAAGARGGHISRRALALILTRAAAALGDGHTFVDYDGREPGDRFPPFVLGRREGQFVVRAAVAEHRSLEGQAITAIEGVPIAQYLAPLLALCSGETLVYRTRSLLSDQAGLWALSGLLAGKTELRVSAGRLEQTVRTVDRAAFRPLVLATADRRPASPSFRFLGTAGRIGYFHYPSFVNDDANRAIIAELFTALQQRRAQALIMDLRGNGGGNSKISDVILGFLTDKPLRQYSRIRTKISPELVKVSGGRFAAGETGKVVVEDLTVRPRGSPGPRFGGRFYLLTDSGTFSSASDFAAIVRDYELGVIIGEETGGVPGCFGDTYSSRLPHSGVPFYVSFKEFAAPVPRPEDGTRGVVPHLPATAEALRPFTGEADPVLALALARAERETRSSK